MLTKDCLGTDEVFSHEDPGGLVRHYNASAMNRAVKLLVLQYQSHDFVTTIKSCHGTEEDHMPMSMARIDEPALGVAFNDAKAFLIPDMPEVLSGFILGKEHINENPFDRLGGPRG